MTVSKFWKYQVRYRLARRLIYIGLFVMPNGRYKDDVLAALWDLYDKVVAEADRGITPVSPWLTCI